MPPLQAPENAHDGSSAVHQPVVRRGVLLANLGTPASPQRRDVARFLREFLSDPRVVDLPRWLWLPLLNLVIVPLRAGRSAAAYREIWWEEGSPLLILTQRLAARLQDQLGQNWHVAAGMRYGAPSIESALAELRDVGVSELTVLPLYPQYSGTTTASIFDAVERGLVRLNWRMHFRRIDDYHAHPAWVEAVAASIREFNQQQGEADQLLFSLHGIPQRYVRAGDPYEQQCRDSVAAIARAAQLDDDRWKLSFQSRVGREPWLQPYTDQLLEELAGDGLRKVQVICPGFAVDCLETLEEIAMQNRELFEENGGESLKYIPALNDTQRHASALAAIVKESAT